MTDNRPVHPLERKPPVEDAAQERRLRVHFQHPARADSWLVPLLIGLNAAVYLLGLLLPDGENRIVELFANNGFAVLQQGEYWRLFTSMWLHAGFAHILLNMLTLFNFGRMMVEMFGTARFLTIYILGGLTGSLFSAIFNSPNTLSVGASGALFALIGAQIVLLSRNRGIYGAGAVAQLRSLVFLAVLYLIIPFASEFLGGGGMFNLDNFAHLGGLVGGLIIAFLIGPIYKRGKLLPKPDDGVVYLVLEDLRSRNDQVSSSVFYAAVLVGVLLVVRLLQGG
jgi:rhomboid protease GluP